MHSPNPTNRPTSPNHPNLTIAVVGAGAIGGLIAARLARAGRTVKLLARGAHLDAIRQHGLTAIEAGERYTVQLEVSDHAADFGVPDVLLICLKGQALVQAAGSLRPLVGPRTHIVSAMNGVPWWFLHEFGGEHAGRPLESVDPGGLVSHALPPQQASGIVVHLSSSIVEPGVIRLNSGNELIVGAGSSPLRAAAAQLADVLLDAGFEIKQSESIRGDVWAKLWGNMTVNSISALTRATTDKVLDDPLTHALMVSVMHEAREIGERLGISAPMTVEQRNAITRKLGVFKPSMLQDVEAGRQIEVEALLGAPYELALATGVAAPATAALYGLARQLDQWLGQRQTG